MSQVGGTGAIALPAGTAVRITQPAGTEDMVRRIWIGRNGGIAAPLDTRAQIAAIIAGIKSYVKQYLVLGITSDRGGAEDTGSSSLTAMLALNASLLALYGDRFVDVYKMLRGDAPYDDTAYSSGKTLAGISSFSAQGATDLAAGRIPIDFYKSGDTLHFNDLGFLAIDRTCLARITAKGWNA